ncbi:MAG: 30S ribosomal protein S7 [Candidatus Saganbacteria bacterium]|nr:30S ribosomal protein S7 [Candidatus Saganbacteria bacterium]
MPRHGKISKRTISSDPVYDSVLLHKFINKMMLGGKKSVSEGIIYKALADVEEKMKKPALEVFEKALENVTPLLQVKARRVGGATYQVPVEISKSRGQAQAMQWIRDVCRERSGKSMAQKLSAELIDAYNGAGGSIKKKEDLHKTAEANKAFAHFRW